MSFEHLLLLVILIQMIQVAIISISIYVGLTNKRQIDAIHLATNSMKDALVLGAYDKGMSDQRAKDLNSQPMERLRQIEKQIEQTGQPLPKH